MPYRLLIPAAAAAATATAASPVEAQPRLPVARYALIAFQPTSALADTGQAAPVQTTAGLGGPVVAGVCLLSREAVIANAKVGLAATARLRTLGQDAQAEVDAERKPVDVDVEAFNATSEKLPAEQRQSRQLALATRLQPIEAKAAQRNREIDATRTKVLARISGELQPVVAQVYRARGCGLLVDRNSVIGGNMANDLTPAVVQGLDAKIATLTFDREVLPAGAATR